MNTFIFTCGDINGIGVEIVIKSLNKITAQSGDRFVLTVPLNVFEKTAADCLTSFDYEAVKKTDDILKSSKQVVINNIGPAKQNIGRATKESGRVSFLAIQKSFEIINNNKNAALITAPISKTSLFLAGINFPGHTEMFAQWCGHKDFVMTFLSKKMIAALLTIHIPIKKVPGALKKNEIISKLHTITGMLERDLNIKQPKAALLGLNPHAGELGIIGREEQDLLNPIVNSKEFAGKLFGTFSPDAFFANKLYGKYDAVIGLYHDQVLIPFKLLNFSSGVNYTAGLPVIRTSPDHGTAFDIAGQNIADPSSMLEAYFYAKKILKNRLINEKENYK
jgi:4-hydroxythreonine-4-phosphate dehydrogenase